MKYLKANNIFKIEELIIEGNHFLNTLIVEEIVDELVYESSITNIRLKDRT